MTATRVAGIFIYPIKSLDRVAVAEAGVERSGALQHDRELALFDEEGKWINGKRDPRVHLIRTAYDLHRFTVTLRREGDLSPRTFHLLENQRELEGWFSEFFGERVHLRRDQEVGFPDDIESPGPTVISSATLKQIGAWFKIPDGNETGRRFRANIEIDSTVPFWEDRLFGKAGEVVKFRIGDVVLHGINPCQRCVVPSRDSRTAAGDDGFQRRFATMRQATLPSWAEISRFNHFYRVSINTRIPPSEAGKSIRVGDPVLILPEGM